MNILKTSLLIASSLIFSLSCLSQTQDVEKIERADFIPSVSNPADILKLSYDHGGRNGGDGLEIQIELMGKKITSFLNSELGREAFPEINTIHLNNVMKSASFTVTTDSITDRFGTVRTCTNDQSSMEIVCDVNRWNIIKDPKVHYILVFHEILGLMNLELGYQRDVSMYPISFKLVNFLNEVENSDVGQQSLRPEYYSLKNVSYGIEIVSSKTKEKIRLICLEGVEVHKCQEFSYVRTFKDKQAPLNGDIASLSLGQLSLIHGQLQELKRKAYVGKSEVAILNHVQNMNNFKGNISLMGQSVTVNEKEFLNIENLMLMTLKKISNGN